MLATISLTQMLTSFPRIAAKVNFFQNTNFISVMRRSQQIAKTNDRAQKFLIAIKNTLFSITN